MKTYAIGIDFGTTKTLVSYYDDKSGRTELVRLGRGHDDMPTTVYVSPNGDMQFGEDADDMSEINPEGYCRGFKMKLGRSVPVLVCGQSRKKYTAYDLTRYFLEYIRKQVENEVFMGNRVTKAVITRPVMFSPVQCDELTRAAYDAGFADVKLVTEPEAAGYAFCTLSPSEAFNGNALIVDWGGGTLDLAIVSREGERVTVHREYVEGDLNMGGEVFDEKLWNEIVKRMKMSGGPNLEQEDIGVQNRMLRQIRQAKEVLSKNDRFNLRLSGGGRACPAQGLSRNEFEGLIRADVEKAAGLVQRLMASIRGRSLQPELLLLVGGTSQIPLIASTLQYITGLPCKKWNKSREAVSLGAGLMTTERKKSTSRDDTIYMRSSSSSLEIELTPEEMANGCKKMITVRGKNVKIGIPAGVYSGEKLTLPAGTISGVGEITLRIKQLKGNTQSSVEGNRPKPVSLPFYVQGLEYLHGINGKSTNYFQAQRLFVEGYQQGDLNAAYMLCHCYLGGIGSPIDYSMTRRLAEYLVSQHYYPAYYFLWNIYSSGYGVPMDKGKAGEYADLLERTCSHPIDGIDEILRYDALLNYEGDSDNKNPKKLERLARENFSISNLPVRYGWLIVPLLDNLDNPSVQQEVRQLLDAGCQQRDEGSMLFKGILLMNDECPVYQSDPDQGKELIRQAATYGISNFLFYELNMVANENEIEPLLNRFWKSCQLGPSGLRRSDDLHCAIEVILGSSSWIWRVREHNAVLELLNQEKLHELVAPLPPRLGIRNEGDKTLTDLHVRICSRDVSLDKTILLKDPLPPGESVVIDPFDYDLHLGDKLYVEVRSGDRYSTMDLGCDLSEFQAQLPPLIMSWDRGLWGGCILKLFCTRGEMTNVVIRKQSGQSSSMTLREGEAPVAVGWMEFSDSASLKHGELFAVSSDQYGTILGQLVEYE